MLANKLFPLLTKPEVQELILLSGKPPVAVVNGSYRRLSAQVLQDDDIMAVIASAQGQEHAPHLADGVQWDFVAPGVGKVAVTARYDGPSLRMTLRLAGLSVQDLPAVDAPPSRARRDAAVGGDAGKAAPVPAEARSAPRAQRAAEPAAREVRPRPRSGSSQNIPAQPQQIVEALDLDSLAPAARLKPPQQRAKDPRVEPEAFDPTLRDDLAPPAPEPRPRDPFGRGTDDTFARDPQARDPLARGAADAFARDPQARDPLARGAADAFARDARDPQARDPFGRGAADPLARDPQSRAAADAFARDPQARDPQDPLARGAADPFAREPQARDPLARGAADPFARDPQSRAAADAFARDAREPQARDPLARGAADAFARDPQARDPLARGTADPFAREPQSRDPQDPLARGAADPFARDGREAFGGLLAEEPDAFAAEPPAAQARRIPALDSLDEPAAPPPRPAPRAAKRDRHRASGKSDALDVLFDRARQLHASDLHVLADRPATLRLAGELVPQPEVFDPTTLEQLLLPRIPAAVRAVLDRDGSCDFALVHPEHGRFRANVGRQRTGLKLTARPISDEIPSLADLGLPTSIEGALEHHQGLIVITGPTGHGKTTTLAALTGILNRETSHHVITVEDPIEFVHPTAKAVISQREVGSHTKSFAAALKGSLREDPDVIVVGELRDTETVRMALSASETGHLVISTMNTPSAAKAIERLIDLFPPGDQPQVRMTLAGGLRLIISQRLVPSADRKQLVAACEVLPGSTPLWALIRENRTFQIASLQQRGRSIGIIRMDDSLAELVKTGKTSLEIAREYADSTELLTTLIQGRPQQARPDQQQQAPENQNDPDQSLQKRGVELGKQVLSRAGKLFGGENK